MTLPTPFAGVGSSRCFVLVDSPINIPTDSAFRVCFILQVLLWSYIHRAIVGRKYFKNEGEASKDTYLTCFCALLPAVEMLN